jgi:hypothetical protein
LDAPPGAPGSASPIRGAPGTVAGVTAADRADGGLLPAAFAATTWKV